jgi:hypothetical protein
MAFFWPLYCKAQHCGDYGLKWSYWQILQSPLWSFAAPSGLSLVSLLPLINALLAWSVSFGGRPSLGRFVVVPYSFHFLIMGCSKFPIFFITQPWSVRLHNFVPDLFGDLLGLHGAACLVVLLGGVAWWCCLVVPAWLCPMLRVVADSGAIQNRCIYTEIIWQIMWHLDITQVVFI